MTTRHGHPPAQPGQDTVIVADGRRLRLGRRLNSGGAGSIHLVDGAPGQVAKIYHPGSNHAGYLPKLEAMLRLRPDLPDRHENGKRYVQIAWPQAIAFDSGGRFTGFLMPMLDMDATRDVEHILNERQAREAGLPTGLGARATLAANLSNVLAALHGKGHRVVDLKPLNLRFYTRSLYIAMLDCDGFSIQGQGTRFRAPQVTADYLAPEYQQRGIDDGDEEAQDRFALAVIVFQLLNSGIHPYSGQPRHADIPTDLPGRIRTGHYPYGIQAHRQIAPIVTSGHAAMPPRLRSLFDRAFSGPPDRRPAAAEWSELLGGYARRDSGLLTVCAQDGSHQHFHGLPCASCRRGKLLSRARKASVQAKRRRRVERAAQPRRAPHAPAPARPAGHAGAQPQALPPIAPMTLQAKVGWLLAGTILAALTAVPIINRMIPTLPTDPAALVAAHAPAEPTHAPGGDAWKRRTGLAGRQARIEQATTDIAGVLDAVLANDPDAFSARLQRLATYARLHRMLTPDGPAREQWRLYAPTGQLTALIRQPGRSIDAQAPGRYPTEFQPGRHAGATLAGMPPSFIHALQANPHHAGGWHQLHLLLLGGGEGPHAAAAYAVMLALSSGPKPPGAVTHAGVPETDDRAQEARRHGLALANALGPFPEPDMDDEHTDGINR